MSRNFRAYDPDLEERCAELCENSEDYFLKFEIERVLDQLHYQRNTHRALEMEMERTLNVLRSFKKALEILKKEKPHKGIIEKIKGETHLTEERLKKDE